MHNFFFRAFMPSVLGGLVGFAWVALRFLAEDTTGPDGQQALLLDYERFTARSYVVLALGFAGGALAQNVVISYRPGLFADMLSAGFAIMGGVILAIISAVAIDRSMDGVGISDATLWLPMLLGAGFGYFCWRETHPDKRGAS